MMNYTMPTYKTLLHYGEITADYQDEKSNTRITHFHYGNENYKVVKQNGKVISLKKGLTKA